jgi:tight adherence protein C
MSAFAISLASFLGVFGAIWLLWERRDQSGRRLLERVGIKGQEQAAPAAELPPRQLARKLFAIGAPARPQWAERWVVPAVLGGALVGGFLGFRLVPAQSGLAATLGGISCAWIGFAACRRWQQQWWAQEISNGLIDLLDLWTLCLDGGMSFQAALARAAQDPELARPALRRELLLTHQEIMAGLPSDEALRNLVRRCRGATELSGMVSHIVQSEKLGGSIAKTLQVYANTLRFNRYQDMKENVQKMPAKLAFPLIFCILPCLLIVIAGPAMLRLFEVLSRHAR